MNPPDARLDGGLEGADRVEVPLDGFCGGLTGVLFDWSNRVGGSDRVVVRLAYL